MSQIIASTFVLCALLATGCGGDPAAAPATQGDAHAPPSPAPADAAAPDGAAPPAAPCSSAFCVVSPEDVKSAYGYEIVASGDEVFWTAWGMPDDPPDGRVFAAKKDGSAPARVLAQGRRFPTGIAADATHLYVAIAEESTVLRCSHDDCETTPFLTRTEAPYGVAVDDGAVYVAFRGDVGGATGVVVRCEKAGCASGGTVLASGLREPEAIAVTDTTVLWTERQGFTLTSAVTNAVYACPKAGCGANSPTLVADGQVGAAKLRVAGGAVYWLNQGSLPQSTGQSGAKVMAANADGSGVRLVAEWSGFLDDLAPAANGVVVVDPGQVAWVPKSGAPVRLDLPNSDVGRAVTTDGTSIFVLTSAGSVQRRHAP